VEVNGSIKWTPVINKKLDIVALIDIEWRTRILAIHGNNWPDNAGNGFIRPCQSDREKHRGRSRPLAKT
jgi:hypothetical protein